jgi:ribosomal protein L17
MVCFEKARVILEELERFMAFLCIQGLVQPPKSRSLQRGRGLISRRATDTRFRILSNALLVIDKVAGFAPISFAHNFSGHGRMGFISTTRSITLRARRKGRAFDGFRKFGPPVKQWEETKRLLDRLIVEQKFTGPLLRVKELQQYAEEVVVHARKNNAVSDSIVESMLISSEARQVVYEELVPRYTERPNMFTRVVNSWHRRDTDSTRIGFIEFVDRPGEFVPAPPVGKELEKFNQLIQETGSRRDRRRLESINRNS